MWMVKINDLCKQFGETKAVNHIHLDIKNGEMLCLLGPSGCGKTTLLRLLSGFLTPDNGSITMDDVDVTALPPEKRPTSLVFQNYALFPHLDVYENIAFGLRVQKQPSEQIKEKVNEMLRIVGLEGKEHRAISQLSGGQQQRVALARALIMKPKVLLLDEPLSNLDAKLRVETRRQIREIQKAVGITSIFVTHDQEEALTMADRIAVMNKGNIEQIDTPRKIYTHPTNYFVADFIGQSNVFTIRPDKDSFLLPSGQKIKAGSTENYSGKDNLLILRPEYLFIAPLEATVRMGQNILIGEIEESTYLGDATHYKINLGKDGFVYVKTSGYTQQYETGEEVQVYWGEDIGHIIGGSR